MKKILLFALFLLALCPHIVAQQRVIVYDLETKVPVRDVLLWADTLKCGRTNYLGEMLLPEKYDTLVVTKPGYIALKVPSKLVKDSIPMLKDVNAIGEVVVYGEDKSDALNALVGKWTKVDKTEYALQHPVRGISFDMTSIFNSKKRRQKKQRQKLQKIFAEWDEQDNNPIVKAYKEAIRKQQKP